MLFVVVALVTYSVLTGKKHIIPNDKSCIACFLYAKCYMLLTMAV